MKCTIKYKGLEFTEETFKQYIKDNPKEFLSLDLNVKQTIQGENISSKGSDFAKKLTNVGNNLAVEYKGKTYINSEHAYQTWKSGEFNQKGYDLKGGKVRGGKIGDTFSIMTDILTNKLQQHPDLIQGINERGGLDYLANSTHDVIGDKFWESKGENKFIEALVQAAINVGITNAETETEQPTDLSQTNIPGINSLITTKVSNFNAGIQLNAEHDTEDAKVTAPTQMLNGAIFRAFSLDEIYQVYEAIGNIVDQELTYVFNGNDSDNDYNGTYDIPELVKGLSNAKYYAKNKPIILGIFKEILKNKVEKDEEFTLEKIILETFSSEELPIDDAHIYKSSIAELASYFTKKGVRINFDGMFAVLAPAAKMHQFIEVTGGYLPVKQNDLTVKYIALPKNKKTVLNMENFKKWDSINSFLLKGGLNEQLNVSNIGEIQSEAPRDLKGQQLIIDYDDGTSEDLSVLRKGETHLLREAEVLHQIKEFNTNELSDYNKLIQSKTTFEDKVKAHNSYIKKYKTKIKDILKNDPEMSKIYDSFELNYKQFQKAMKKDDPDKKYSDMFFKGTNTIDFIHRSMSNSYTGRIKMKQEAFENKDNDKYLSLIGFEFNDITTSINKLYLSLLQKSLNTIESGTYPQYLLDYAATNGKNISKIKVSRAEVVAPITAKNAFLLREGDDLSEVNEEMFYNRLNEKLSVYDVDADQALIINNNKRIFFKKGKPKKNSKLSQFVKKFDNKLWFINEAGNRLFEIPKGTTVTVENGELFVYYNEDSLLLKFINNIKKNKFLKSATKNNGTSIDKLGTAEERAAAKIRAMEVNRQKAKEMFVSWEKYLDIIGTRIPGQHYQSFQGLKIVGFAEGNKIYVPDEVTLLSGSDFDIDKQNIIFYSITNDGMLATWHPASKIDTRENLDLSLQLPLPAKRDINYFTPLKDVLGLIDLDPIIEGIDDNVENIDLKTLLNVYDSLNKGFKLSPQLNPNLINLLLDYEEYVDTDSNNGIAGIKNFTLSKFNNAISNTSNFTLLSNPVSMADIGLYADNSEKGKLVKELIRQLPSTVLSQKTANMVGKEVIGIMASSGLKSLSALTLFHNQKIKEAEINTYRYNKLKAGFLEIFHNSTTEYADLNDVDEISYIINDLNISETLKDQLSLLYEQLEEIKKKTYLDMFANVPGEALRDVHEIITSPKALANLNLNKNTFSKSLLANYYLRLKGYKAVDNDILSLINYGETDVADLISQLLSAATDNAKELKLDKLNATPDLAGIYASQVMFGNSFEEVYFNLTNPNMEFLLRRAVKNVYNPNTAKNSINSFLTTIKGAIKKRGTASYVPDSIVEKLSKNYGVRIDINNRSVIDNKTKKSYSIDELKKYLDYLGFNNELSILSKYLGINQGVKSNDWELYDFTYSLENFAKSKGFLNFNMKDFLDSVANNGDYHKQMNFGMLNIPQILIANPHFIKQLTAYNVANTMLNTASYKIKSVYNITEKLRDVGFLMKDKSLNKEQFRQTVRFVEDSVLSNFVRTEHDSPNRPMFFNKSGEAMTLETDSGRIKFIKWFNEEFVPHLQDTSVMTELTGNDFINAITNSNTKFDPLLNNEFKFSQLLMDTTNVKSNTQSNYRDAYLYNLDLIYKNQWKDRLNKEDSKRNNIFDVLFWYNFILNKNNISKNSYAKFLGEILITENKDNVYKRLLKFEGLIGKNDSEYKAAGYNTVSNGVEFDIVALLPYYEMTAATKKAFVPTYRGDGEDDFIPDDIDIPEVDNYDMVEDTTGETYFDDDDVYQEMADELDDEGEALPVKQLLVNKERGNRGEEGTNFSVYERTYHKNSKPTDVVIYQGNSGQLISSILMDPSRYRNRNSNINMFSGEDINKDLNDNLNYTRLSSLSLYELLSKLNGKIDDIEIIQTDSQNREIISKFDPNKTYECL